MKIDPTKSGIHALPLDDAFWSWEEDYTVPEPERGRLHERVLQDPISRLNAPAPIVLKPTDLVALAIERMRKRRYGSVLIADKAGRLKGIFTEHDLAKAAAGSGGSGKSVAERRLEEVMTVEPQSLEARDSIAYAIHHMAVGGYRHVPIVEKNRPVGFVSIRGILKYLERNALSG